MFENWKCRDSFENVVLGMYRFRSVYKAISETSDIIEFENDVWMEPEIISNGNQSELNHWIGNWCENGGQNDLKWNPKRAKMGRNETQSAPNDNKKGAKMMPKRSMKVQNGALA